MKPFRILQVIPRTTAFSSIKVGTSPKLGSAVLPLLLAVFVWGLRCFGARSAWMPYQDDTLAEILENVKEAVTLYIETLT